MDSTNALTTNELCNVCAALNISPHKFNRQVDDSFVLSNSGFDDKGLDAINIGFLDHFYRRRSNCPFCRLVYQATHREDGQGVGHDGLSRDGHRVSCWLDWQLDGRCLASQNPGHSSSSGAVTRRLRLFSKTEEFQECYLMPLRQEDGTQSPSFQARTVHPQQTNIQQLRSWLNLCTSHHGKCTGEQSRHAPMKLRVIDVSIMRIVEIFSDQRYFTLSYCWGRTKPFCLLTSNYDELTCRGIPSDVLPRTISDALQVVLALGEQYLWVDALCIIQDNPSDWGEIAPLMDKIYGTSILTICAASGDSCVYGLPGSQQRPRMLTQPVQDCAGLKLLAFKTLEDRIEHSPWNTRAWTFQERMLSRRCLIFVDDRVFFQCRQVTWSEELDCESSVPFWTLDTVNSPLNLFGENPLRRYSKSVELYSGRSVTYQSDRLIAFEGIALSLSHELDPLSSSGAFQYGLPTCYFDWALLWELKTPAQRINQNTTGVIFPSWSWCGWTGSAEWKMSTTSTVLLNLHEWLMMHTWIIWYLGTDAEHQLIFQVDDRRQVASTRGRWAGYSPVESEAVVGSSEDYDAYGRPAKTRNLATKPTYPPLKGHLHFFTWSAFFKLSRESMSESSFKSKLQPGLHRFSLLDRSNDWYGTIILNESFYNSVGAVFEFIAISEARDFALEEYDSWNYYVPGEREEAEWYLYYVLMIRWNEEKSVAERLGLGKIFKTAFQSGAFGPGYKWKEITLG